MADRPDSRAQLESIVRLALNQMSKELKESNRIPLGVPTWDSQEILEAIDSLLRGQLTMGKKVAAFEDLFADYIGTTGAVMVNSGSSANLLAMMLATNPETEDPFRPGDEVITPAVTWSTTVFSIIAAGLTPVLVDVNPETFLMEVEEVEKALSNRTRAIFCVHLLGNPCDLKALSSIAEEQGLLLIEDACESHGAEVEDGGRTGSIGDVSTFSFFFSHHLTTIEGGMVLARDPSHLDILRSLRAHGWIRERSDRELIAGRNRHLDPRFLFANIGFNFRPTEIQGAFGIHQLAKIEEFIKIRRDNASFLTKRLQKYESVLGLPRERRGTRHVYFSYPVVVREDSGFKRQELQSFLEAQGIETRPIMSGNIARHPALRLFRVRQQGDLKNADMITENGFFFGIHQGIREQELNFIADSFDSFMNSKRIAG